MGELTVDIDAVSSAAKRVRAARSALSLKQPACAELLDVHPVTLCRWETSQLRPSAYKLLLLETLADAAKTHPRGQVEMWMRSYGPVSTLELLLSDRSTPQFGPVAQLLRRGPLSAA